MWPAARRAASLRGADADALPPRRRRQRRHFIGSARSQPNVYTDLLWGHVTAKTFAKAQNSGQPGSEQGIPTMIGKSGKYEMQHMGKADWTEFGTKRKLPHPTEIAASRLANPGPLGLYKMRRQVWDKLELAGWRQGVSPAAVAIALEERDVDHTETQLALLAEREDMELNSGLLAGRQPADGEMQQEAVGGGQRWWHARIGPGTTALAKQQQEGEEGGSVAVPRSDAAAPAPAWFERENAWDERAPRDVRLFGDQPTVDPDTGQLPTYALHPAELEEPRPTAQLETPEEDPTAAWIRQGREMLEDMEDGGRVACIGETGVPGLWCIQLENLTQGNAITGDMMLQLEENMRMITRALKTNHEILAVIIRGGGHNFSFGTSPTIHQEKFLADEGMILSRYMHAIMLELSCMPVITIAALEGVCAGTAAELAAACDFRVISENGMIQFADTHLGLTPGWGGAQRVAKLTSSRAALLMMASGRAISPEDALKLGLVDKISRAGETYEDAVDFVKDNLHSFDALGGTHGELTYRRDSIKSMKDIVVASELFDMPESYQATEARNFSKLWDINAKGMAEKRLQAIGLRRAAVNYALEDWSIATDPFATSIPPDEEVGRFGYTPAEDDTMWGQMKIASLDAFDAVHARDETARVPVSPQSSIFSQGRDTVHGSKMVGSGQRDERDMIGLDSGLTVSSHSSG